MSGAPLPPNEEERLASLASYGVVGELAESSVQALVRLASRLTHSPIALVSFIDRDRQWFFASDGIDARETPRDVAFCAHAILEPGAMFEVEDARCDPRFADNPFVTGDLRVRSYAGVPLVSREGHALGTLCVVGHEPRRLDDLERATLRDLAAAVLELLETRRSRLERERAEAALRIERAFLTQVLDHLPHTVVFVLDDEGFVARTFGVARLSTTPTELVPLEPRTTLHSLLDQLRFDLAPARDGALRNAIARCMQGETTTAELAQASRHFGATLVPLPVDQGRVLVLLHDVTERDALREHITRQERLVTVGTLAAGIGHEINNPLTWVSTNVDLAIEALTRVGEAIPDGPELLGSLREAREGTDRIQRVVQGLRALGRDETTSARSDVQAALELALQMATTDLRRIARLERDLSPVPAVCGDEARISQVLVNLLVNAAECFPGGGPDANRVIVRTRALPNGHVAIEVEDNGPGIAADVLPRIFDPFFTTKPTGHGIGLGLAVSHSITSALGGELTCTSIEGQGTTFRVELPPARMPSLLPAHLEPVTPARRGRVLVVDDEPLVLRAVTRLLRNEHDVETVQDPRNALPVILGRESFDVILCDLTMPHMSGMDLFRTVAAESPERAARFVFVSGAVLHDDVREFLAGVPNERIDKPFQNQTLRDLARRFVETS